MSEDSTAYAPAAGVCPRHPEAEAPYVCGRCGTFACVSCCYSLDDGSVCCTDCWNAPPAPAPAVVAPPPLPPKPAAPKVEAPKSLGIRLKGAAGAASSPKAAEPVPVGGGCVQHPDVALVAFCKSCRKGVCGVCDFSFPEGVHLCPECVVKNQGGLTPFGKKCFIGGLAMAGTASLGFVGLIIILGVFGEQLGEAGTNILDFFGTRLALYLSAGGAALCLSCFRKGATSWYVWVVAIWNFLILGTLLLMVVAANLL